MMTRLDAFKFACDKFKNLLDSGWDLGYGQMVDGKMDIFGYPPPNNKKTYVATLIVKNSTEVEFLQEN